MAASESLASNFYNALKRDNVEAFKILESLAEADNPYRESEWIEYKGGYFKDKSEMEAEWSKQLSGFANSGDGLVVYGLNTTKKNGFDVPSSKVLVKNAKQFAGELVRIAGFAVEPFVRGIDVLPVVNDKGEGFVVAFVPESKTRPHQVRYPKIEVQDRYYIRAGHETKAASPSLLRILFYPQTSPRLNLVFCNQDNKTVREVEGELFLENDGDVSISDLQVVITNGQYGVKFNRDLNYFDMHNSVSHSVTVNCIKTFHPEMSIPIGVVTIGDRSNYVVHVYGKDMRPFRWRLIEGDDGFYEAIDIG